MTRPIQNPRCEAELPLDGVPWSITGAHESVVFGCDLTTGHDGDHTHRLDENRTLGWPDQPSPRTPWEQFEYGNTRWNDIEDLKPGETVRFTNMPRSSGLPPVIEYTVGDPPVRRDEDGRINGMNLVPKDKHR